MNFNSFFVNKVSRFQFLNLAAEVLIYCNYNNNSSNSNSIIMMSATGQSIFNSEVSIIIQIQYNTIQYRPIQRLDSVQFNFPTVQNIIWNSIESNSTTIHFVDPIIIILY